MILLRRSAASLFLLVVALGRLGVPCCEAADERPAPLVASFLESGRLAEGEKTLVAKLKERPDDDQTRFELGTLQFLKAVEQLAQAWHRHGLRDHGRMLQIPLLRLPLPENPNPEPLDYDGARRIVQTFLDGLARSEATLAGVKAADVRLPLHFGRIRLDVDGDGHAGADESLWRMYVRLNGRAAAVPQAEVERFLIVFDKADVFWLRGYCHLLASLGEAALAHDMSELFERTAHLLFPKVESPYKFLDGGRRVFQFGAVDVADLIAMIHLINFPVREPARMKTALAHLESVIALSRENWRELLAETDDDHEWIPNPRQTGVIPGVQVTLTMVDGWSEFLAEAEQIVQGKKLIPFWRGAYGPGVNLRRVFVEPRRFDLVLWAQGTAASPYLEEGVLSTPDVWRRFDRLFRGQFLGFALWFN